MPAKKTKLDMEIETLEDLNDVMLPDLPEGEKRVQYSSQCIVCGKSMDFMSSDGLCDECRNIQDTIETRPQEENVWDVKDEDIIKFLNFEEVNHFTLEITLEKSVEEYELIQFNAPFGITSSIRVPEGMLGVNSKRLRRQLKKVSDLLSEQKAYPKKIRIRRIGFGFDTQYSIQVC